MLINLTLSTAFCFAILFMTFLYMHWFRYVSDFRYQRCFQPRWKLNCSAESSCLRWGYLGYGLSADQIRLWYYVRGSDYWTWPFTISGRRGVPALGTCGIWSLDHLQRERASLEGLFCVVVSFLLGIVLAVLPNITFPSCHSPTVSHINDFLLKFFFLFNLEYSSTILLLLLV